MVHQIQPQGFQGCKLFVICRQETHIEIRRFDRHPGPGGIEGFTGLLDIDGLVRILELAPETDLIVGKILSVCQAQRGIRVVALQPAAGKSGQQGHKKNRTLFHRNSIFDGANVSCVLRVQKSTRKKYEKIFLEEGNGLLLDFREQVIGHTADSEAEEILVEPILAQHGSDNGIIAGRISRRGHTASRLETDLDAGEFVVGGYALAHHEGGYRGGVHLDLSRRGLYEIGAGLHREEGGLGYVFRTYENTGLDYDLEYYTASLTLCNRVYAMAYLKDLIRGPLVVSCHESIESQHYIHLVSSLFNCKFAFLELDLDEALRAWETSRNDSHVHPFRSQGFLHGRSEIRKYADGCRVREIGIALLEGIDLAHEFQYGLVCVLSLERGEVHHREAILHHLGGSEVLKAAGNVGKAAVDLLDIRSIGVFFQIICHNIVCFKHLSVYQILPLSAGRASLPYALQSTVSVRT